MQCFNKVPDLRSSRCAALDALSTTLTRRWLLACVALLAAAFAMTSAFAHNVGQTQMTKFFTSETVQLLVDRANAGKPGLVTGDVISYIIRFTPVANGANIGVAGYITDYIPPGTQVIGASIVAPSGSTFVDVAPSLPGSIDDGWGRGQNTFTAPFATAAYDATGLCAKGGFTNRCNARIAELYADTGIFFSTDARTAVFPSPPTRVAQGTNGYVINPTAAGGLNALVGNPSNATTHNLWDAQQTNAFGSSSLPGAAPNANASQGIINSAGNGATPFGAGSAVAGPQTGYQLDNTAAVGPWQRIAYMGSRIGSTASGPATSQSGASAFTIAGTPTGLGWSVSAANPLPAGTNAVRWAIGNIIVGNNYNVKLTLKLTAPPPAGGIINSSEVFGGDAGGADDGKDNTWRYHVPSVADNVANLYLFKTVVCVYSGVTCNPSDGVSVPPNAKVRFRITYLNIGNNNQTNVVLSDTLPVQTAASSVSNAAVISGPNILPFTPANPAAKGATITFQTIATLLPGGGGAVEFDVQTNAGDGDTLKNLARLVTTLLPAPGVTSQSVSAVQNTANLTISKTVTPSTVMPGGTVTYTITVTNIGAAAASSIVVRDFLPTSGGAANAATRFSFNGSNTVKGIASVAPVAVVPPTITPYNTEANRQQLTWTFGASLAAGASFTIQFGATVGASVPASATPYTNDSQVDYSAGFASTIGTAPVTVPLPPNFIVLKSFTLLSDPINASTNPRNIPGAEIQYSIQVTNTGAGNGDNNSVSTIDAIPPYTELFVGDLSGAGTGPIRFVQGTPTSNLTWTYTALANLTDDVDFSNNNGSSWGYVPTPPYDSTVTHIRLNPKGLMAASGGSGNPSFQLQFKVRLK